MIARKLSPVLLYRATRSFEFEAELVRGCKQLVRSVLRKKRVAPSTVFSPPEYDIFHRMTLTPCIVPIGGDHCDFCRTSPVFTVYPCSNFLVNGFPVFPGRNTGSWATCRKCAELVDSEKWSDLSERACRKFLKRHGTSRHEMPAVRVQFAELSRLFAGHLVKGA